ncbi:efflux RND transporter permease subunit [Reinekea thalattae]|uniref:Efflux RND transporter permease subunit n=1 Tax=Reinekea thalattae TaxID=2593301 RepID=A0A5C8ZAT8_9GAMM|nr:efflux RND transporter permease subunit [Reinekea thalattae]TXR54389.1 efflux RND transporter permease subunit [Reinekea thalattae]
MAGSETYEKEGIIGWFARNSVAANLLLVGTIVIGALSLTTLRKEAFPSLSPNSVAVSVSYDSGDPQQAEEGIAVKIEEALESVSGIERITTTSTASRAAASIEMVSGYDLDKLFDDVKNSLDSISDFPTDADSPIIEKESRQDHVIWVQLYGDADRETFQDLATRVKADLLAQSAIRDVSIEGEQEPIISIEINEALLLSYGLTLEDVSSAVNAESSSSVSTMLRNSEKTANLTISDQYYGQQEFANIQLLTLADGSQIRLGDVAKVTEDFDDESYVLSRYNGQPGMALELFMDEYGDVSEIARQANVVVEKWKNSNALPENIGITSWYDSSTSINDRLQLLIKNAVTGIIMVFVILALFLNIRVALWVAAGLPFVFFGSLYFMTESMLGLTINQFTTFGFIMALGIVVDDAVVVGESIYSTRQEEGDTIENTIRGTLKVAVPTIFGVLTTVAAFVALANIEGRLGQIYAQFGTVVMVCLLLSLVESKLILPSHLAHLNTQRKSNSQNYWNKIQNGANAGLQWFSKKCYQPLIDVVLQYRYPAVILFAALFVFVIGWPMNGVVRVSFFPSIEGDTVSGSLSMYEDASFGQTDAALTFFEQAAMKADAELAKKYGSDESQIDSIQVLASSDDSGSITVELKPDAVYGSSEMSSTWTKITGSLEGVKTLSVQSRVRQVDAFRAEIKALDNETVYAAAAAMRAELEQIPGVSDIEDNISAGEPQYRFELNEQGRAMGITTSDLSSQVILNFGGGSVQSFQRDSDEVTVIARLPEEGRQTLSDVLDSMIRTDSGAVVPMNSIVDVQYEFQDADITRIDSLRAVYITTDVDETIISSNELVSLLNSSFVPELQSRFSNLVIDFAGEAEQQAETTDSMKQMFIVALIVIYALLAIPLRSYIQPVLIMMAIPFGIVGAILGHYFTGLNLSILSLFGILALSGVVVNDSLLLVSRFNALITRGTYTLHDAIVAACTSRLRAVLLTSITTFAGLAPILSETSTQAEFLKPAAASLGYGILFATIITLLLIPSILMIQHDIRSTLGLGVGKLKSRLIRREQVS